MTKVNLWGMFPCHKKVDKGTFELLDKKTFLSFNILAGENGFGKKLDIAIVGRVTFLSNYIKVL